MKKAFFVNSALAFAIAELMTAALHEAGHGLMAQALGFAPRIYAFYENNPSGTVHQNLLILAAGPLTSLAIGAVLLAAYQRQPARYSFGRLLLFWFAWANIMELVNYVMVTPWLSAGDTAQIAHLLGWPMWGSYAIAAVALAALFPLAKLATRGMLGVAPSDIPLVTPRDRRRLVMTGFYLPLLAGVLLMAPAGIGGAPVTVLFGLFAAFGNLDLIGASMMFASRDIVVHDRARFPDATPCIEPLAMILYVAVVAFYIVFLSRGLPV
jgi:hypothetical protein